MRFTTIWQLLLVFSLAVPHHVFAQPTADKSKTTKETAKETKDKEADTAATAEEPDTDDIIKGIEYPELMVTPLASERLRLEVKDGKNYLGNYFTIQLSAAMTLYAGMLIATSAPADASTTFKQTVQWTSLAVEAVGATWLALTTYLLFKYTPYEDGVSSINKMGYKTKRQKLTAERMAEESLNSPARLGSRLRYFAFGTNLLAGGMAYMMSGDSQSALYSGIATLLAFGPLIFETHWEDVANTQRDYKKRIYGPVGGVIPDRKANGTYALAPAMTWQMEF